MQCFAFFRVECHFVPSHVEFSVIPGLMLCSIIFMRSALTFEGGHQISVNLFLKAGDSWNKTKTDNFIVLCQTK